MQQMEGVKLRKPQGIADHHDSPETEPCAADIRRAQLRAREHQKYWNRAARRTESCHKRTKNRDPAGVARVPNRPRRAASTGAPPRALPSKIPAAERGSYPEVDPRRFGKR